VVRAVANPYTTILGHPTGRLLLARAGYPLDIDRMLDACARYHTVVELNSDPHRLDLDWRHLQGAVKRGVTVSINPDAHALTGFGVLEYGINTARKGWLIRTDVFNTLPLNRMFGRIRELKQKKMLVPGS
jgi:DNA polymerase (family 10)